MADLAARIPAWECPANGAVWGFQTAHDGVEIFESRGIYCKVCYSVSRDMGVFSQPRTSDESKETVIVGWEVRLDELADAADAGCRFCSFMAARFFDDRAFTFMYGNISSSGDVACCSRASGTERTGRVTTALVNIRAFVEKHPDAQFTLIMQPRDTMDDGRGFGKIKFSLYQSSLDEKIVNEFLGYRSEIVLEFYALKDDPAAEYIPCRPVNINPASDESVEQAQLWIRKCIQEHPQCPGLPNSKLPTRVIKILDDKKLQLIEGGELGSYTILSYCWGGPQTFATTLETIDRNLEAFNTSELPKTLQDAVNLTRTLGLQYIWIDSLCIIQDSATDKEQEIPNMSLYYKNAYVTICAGGATCGEGFLQTHDQCEKHPDGVVAKHLLQMPYLCPTGAIGSVYFREESPYFLSWEPISQRAWTLQERLLSPRVLMYGSRLVWQCHSTQHSEGGVEDWSFDTRASDHRRLQSDLVEVDKAIQKEPGDGETLKIADNISDDIRDIWYRAVHEYSCRKLSFPMDKLPAISGLASEFGKLTGDQYLAGLWRAQLLRDLMWSTYPELRLLRPPTWRAPSWSWASCDNVITFDRLPPADAIVLAKVVNCYVTPRSSISPFGEVSDATLEIDGPLIDQIPSTVIGDVLKKEYMIPGPVGKGEDWRRILINALHDDDEQEAEWAPPQKCALLALFACPIAPDPPTTSSEPQSPDGTPEVDDAAMVHGLVLAEQEDGTYERIGSFTTIRFKGLSNLKVHNKRVRII